jgi:type IV pilus assembly protein PilP
MMRSVCVIALAVALAACTGEEHSDLKQFVKDSDNMPRAPIPPLPEVKPYEPFAYEAFDLTDPFKPRKIEPPKNAGAGGIRPDLNRRREPIEPYPLENLKMVGTLQQKKNIFAIVKTPDNNLFRVKQGNYMGQNFGRIAAITETSIKLKEIVQDNTGAWEEKDQTLQLQDEPEAKK